MVGYQRILLQENLDGEAEQEYSEPGGERHKKEDLENFKLCISIGSKLKPTA